MLLYVVLIFVFWFFFSFSSDESNAVSGLVIQIGSLSCAGFLFNNSLLMAMIQEFAQNCVFWQNKIISKFGAQANKTPRLFLKSIAIV